MKNCIVQLVNTSDGGGIKIMTNCEHLIENALTRMKNAEETGMDTYDAFQDEMSLDRSKMMLNAVSITKDELWEIAQYIIYDWDKYRY